MERDENDQAPVPIIVEPVEEPALDSDSEEEEDYVPPTQTSSKRPTIRWTPGSNRLSVERSSKAESTAEEGGDAAETKSIRSIRFENSHRSSITAPSDKIEEEDEDDSDSDEYVPPPNFPIVKKPSVLWSTPGLEASHGSIQRRVSIDVNDPNRGVPARRTSLKGSNHGMTRSISQTGSILPAPSLVVPTKQSPNTSDVKLDSKTNSSAVLAKPNEEGHLDIPKPQETVRLSASEGVKTTKTTGYTIPLESKEATPRNKQSVNNSRDILKGSTTNLSIADSGKGSTTLKKMAYHNPFIQWFFDYAEYLEELYYEKISLKLESVFVLVALLPFVLLALLLWYMDVAIFPDRTVELLAKVALVIVGQLAEFGVSIVNQRHAELSCMVKVVANRASARDLFETVAGKRVNKVLKYSATLFSAYLIAAELVMRPENVLTEVGSAFSSHLTVTPQNFVTNNASQIFRVTTASAYSCQDCVGYRTDERLFVPISTFMRSINTSSVELDQLFLGNSQDIISLAVHCYDIKNPVSPLMNNQMAFEVKNIMNGVNFTQSDVEVYSRADSTLKGKRCRILMGDFRGKVQIRYIMFHGLPIRDIIFSISPDPSRRCFKAGDMCLNESKRRYLSSSLLRASLSFERMVVERTSGVPDPVQFTANQYFQEEMEKFVGLLLINSASMFVTNEQLTPTFTDAQALNLQVEPILQFTTIGLCLFCLSLASIQIAIDILQLEKASNDYLRKLHLVVKPGKQHLQSISQFSRETIDSAAILDEWDLAMVKFGEDRKTVEEPLGILRFGTRRDIVRFNDDRAYY